MPPADLDFRVKMEFRDGLIQFTYLLHSHFEKAGFTYREVPGPVIPGRLEDFQTHLMAKLDKLGDGYDVDGSFLLGPDVQRKLARFGQDLYLELFPSEMQQVYREIRRHEVQTVRIVSDEPWIPWELIKPYDDSQPADVIDDDFLCMQFELTRWLPGDRPPRSEVRVRRLACIVTDDTLPKVGEERGVLAGLVKEGRGIEDASPSISSASEAMAFLEAGGIDILHFTGHGTFDASQPNESGLPFVNGSVLRPQDLQGRLRTRIGQDRPLVFLNACWSGQQGWSFTRAGGWADRWVRICGCGAFVAPMWPVRDSLALEFAKSFYEALAEGATFGQAARQARENVRELNPGDPSWLAYSVYADVNGRLALGDSPSHEDQWQEPEIPDAPSEIRNKIRDFSRLIARETEGFVGRQWLFDAVDGFVGKQKSGYVLILGDPGIGKSTLIAEMVKRHGHPHHFNVRSEGIRRPEDFLPSVSAQVIAKHGLGYSAIPPDVSRDATFFKAVLERAAAKLLPGAEALRSRRRLGRSRSGRYSEGSQHPLPPGGPSAWRLSSTPRVGSSTSCRSSWR